MTMKPPEVLSNSIIYASPISFNVKANKSMMIFFAMIRLVNES